MAGFLQQLLNAREPLFSTAISQLESQTGYKAIDVSYIDSIRSRAHQAMRHMGLDPADTTELELYRALNNHVTDMRIFVDTDDVGLPYGGQVISFNIDDIKENVDRTFEMRTNAHLLCQLQHGLVGRYVAAGGVDELVAVDLIASSGVNRCDMAVYHEQKLQGQLDAAAPAPSILCIGDIFTDTFIKLNEDEARVDTDADGSQRLSLPFGSKPPYDRADVIKAVGPSPNAAVACARLGLRVSLMAWMGDDQVGSESRQYLETEHISTDMLAVEKGVASNSYYVLRYGADRTILVKDEEYSYRWRAPVTAPDWVYLSLISPAAWPLHMDLLDYLEQNPDVKLAFQPGTFHFTWGAKKLEKIYARSNIVVMNREEATSVTGRSYESLNDLAAGLHELGSETVVITDGPKGSYASYGGKLLQIPNYPDPAAPLDRTGAGDAFASTLVAALALGEPLETALKWAPINSMSVVQKLGAQAGLLKVEEIENYLTTAPADYEAKEYQS